MKHVFVGLGVILFSLSVLSNIQVRRALKVDRLRLSWSVFYRYRRFVGIPLAVLALAARGAGGEGAHLYTWYGFPFEYAAFDLAGRDYVSLFTPFFMMADAFIGFSIPNVIVFLFRGLIPVRHI